MEHDETKGSDDVTRRGFIATAIAVTAACGCCAGEASAQDGPPPGGPGRRPGGPGGGPGGGNPADRAAPEDPKAPKQVDAGPLAAIKQDGVDVKFARTGRFLVIRQDDKVYASSSICTHKSCFLKLKDKQIACPCHGSKFANDGIPEPGAKATDPLVRYGVSVNDKGHVIVDKTKRFEKAQWGDEAAWVKAAPAGATSKPA